MPERNITFEIKEHLGTIANYESGWNKELNVISWNGAPAKYDIREWDEFHTRMKRGITLNPWEMRKMMDLYLTRNSERAVARGKAIEAERNKRRDQAFKQNEPLMEQGAESGAESESSEEVMTVTSDGEVVETESPLEGVKSAVVETDEPLMEKEETPF